MKNSLRIGIILCMFFYGVNGTLADYREDIPFIPTPIDVVERMLKLAQVKKGDVLYDLGSGDGRIVIRAAKKYGIRAVGIEMDALLLEQARKAAKINRVSSLVEFRAEDALKADISSATVVTLYMLPWFNNAIKANLQRMLKPGSRIVAHDFGIEGWTPQKTEKLSKLEVRPGGLKHQHTLYLWKIDSTIAAQN